MRLRRTGFQIAIAMTHGVGIAFALVVASWLRFGAHAFDVWSDLLSRPLLALGLYAALAIGVFSVSGLYRFDDAWSTRAEIGRAARAMLVLAVLTLTLLFLFDLDDVSRILLLYFFIIAWGFITLATLATRKFYRYRRSRGLGVRRVLLVGAGGDIGKFTASLTADFPELGLLVVGFVGREHECPKGVPWRGNFDQLPDLLASEIIDEVLTAPNARDWSGVDEIVTIAQEQGKTVRIPLPALGRSIANGSVEYLNGTPILSVTMTPDHALALATKRILDIVGSLVALVLLSPFLAFAAIGTLIADGRPVLFRQARSGLHGRPIRVMKFRTMRPDAEALRVGIAHQNERDGPAFKMANDPRITKFGRILRKTSIDELPQLFNVLNGEMSLVGPRPLPVVETSELTFADRRRLSMRPGITCLWQIEARDDPSWETWIRLDLEYIDNWSVLTDLSILARTPVALIRNPGT